MIRFSRWRGWGERVTLAVTEYDALRDAERLVRDIVIESEAACNPQRGDAEIHAVNLAQGIPVQVSPRLSVLLRSASFARKRLTSLCPRSSWRIQNAPFSPTMPATGHMRAM